MAGEVGTQMDGLKMVPAGTPVSAGMQPPPQPSPVRDEAATGEGARSSAGAAALQTGGEPVKTEAAAGSSPAGAQQFNPDAFLAQIQNVLDERDRRLQSSLDKRDGNIRKMLAERQGQVNAIGEKGKELGMPDQQVQALQSALINDALTEALKQEDQPSPQPSPTGEGAGSSPAAEVAAAEAKAEAMAELAGLTAEDPEVKLITGYTTPAEYLQKVQAACKAKLARELGAPSQPSPQPSPNGRGSTVGAAAVLGPNGGAASNRPPLERAVANGGGLWREALREEAERRSS